MKFTIKTIASFPGSGLLHQGHVQRHRQGRVSQVHNVHPGLNHHDIENQLRALQSDTSQFHISGDVLRSGEDLPVQPIRPDQGVAAQGLPAHRGRQARLQQEPQELLCRGRAALLFPGRPRPGHRGVARQDAAGILSCSGYKYRKRLKTKKIMLSRAASSPTTTLQDTGWGQTTSRFP